MGIIETEYYEKLRREYERKKMKSAAKKIVKEQIATSIENEITDSKIEKLSQKIALSAKKDMYAQKEARIKIKDKLAVASLPLFVLSIFAAAISIVMSIAGISHIHTLKGMKNIFNTQYWLPALLMGCFEVGTVISSIIAYATKKQYKKLNRTANAFRFCVFVASVYSNHLFLCDLVPEYNYGSGFLFGWFFAAGADIMSNLFSTFSFALKNRMSDSVENTLNKSNVNYLSKIWFCITAKFRIFIDRKYYEKLDKLNDLNKTTKTRKTNTTENDNITKVNNIKSSEIKQNQTTSNEPVTFFKYLVPENIESYEEKLNTFPKGTKLTKNMFGLDQKQWRQVRDYWVKQGIVQCHEKATYKAV